jgi:hypothetical protein
METELNIRKSKIETLQKDLREAETANEELFSKNIDTGPVIDPAVIQANNHISEVSSLSSRHATKLSEIQITKDNALLELNQIQSKTWKADTSNVLNKGKNLPVIDNINDESKGSNILTTGAADVINSFSIGSQNKRLEILKSQLIEENASSNIDDILASVTNSTSNVDNLKINEMLSKLDYTGDSSSSMGANLEKWLHVDSDNSDGILNQDLSPTNAIKSPISTNTTNNSNKRKSSVKKTTFNDIVKKDSIKDNEKINIINKEVNNDVSSIQKNVMDDTLIPELNHSVDSDNESESQKQIRQLQEELKQLKEMKMNPHKQHNSPNDQFPHFLYDPYNQNSFHPSHNQHPSNQFHHPQQQQPYQPHPNPHQAYGFNPYHNPYNPYAHQQQPPPFYSPQHYQQQPPPQQQPQSDPAQSLMLQQLQKMSEQIEKENMKLMEQLSDFDNNGRNNGRNNDRSRYNNNINTNNRDNNNTNTRDNNNDRENEIKTSRDQHQEKVPIISKLEAKHQEVYLFLLVYLFFFHY